MCRHLKSKSTLQAALRRESVEAAEPQTFANYRLVRLLGRGGMGEVYLAEDLRLNRRCAVKRIRGERSSDPRAVAQFRREAEATARLTHPNTVEIYDFGTAEGENVFYAMEYLPGASLQTIVEQTGPLPAARVIHLLIQVCSALGEVHRQGMIHRDVKPGNIFAAERGGVFDVAKLLDFGLVTAAHGESDAGAGEGVVIGSPFYAAPELTLGGRGVDFRADLYSLGATAYFLLTGQPVFTGIHPLKILFSHVHQGPVPPRELRPEVPACLEAVVLRCLAKSPADRFASAGEMERALRDCARECPWTQAEAEDAFWRSAAVSLESSHGDGDELGETSMMPLCPEEPSAAGHRRTETTMTVAPSLVETRRIRGTPLRPVRRSSCRADMVYCRHGGRNRAPPAGIVSALRP